MIPTDGKYHPIVQCYLNSNVLNNLDLLKEKISPEEYSVFKIQKQLLDIIESDIKKSEKFYNKAVSELNNFLFKRDVPDHNLYFLCLIYWFSACLRLEKYVDAKFVKSNLDSALTDKLVPELIAEFYAIQGFYLRKVGMLREGLKSLSKSKKILDANNSKYPNHLITYGNLTCYFCTYPSIKKELSLFRKLQDQNLAPWDNIFNFFYSVEIGDLKTAWICYKKIPNFDNKKNIVENKIIAYASIFKLLSLDWQVIKFSETEKKEIDSLIPLKYPERFNLITSDLVEVFNKTYSKDLEIALELSRKTKHENSSESSWFYCIHLRIELSVGNVNTAELSLKRIKENGYDYFWNDWFQTRIELLKKNTDNARFYFNKLMKSIKKHHAEDRFNFEFKLSHEINITEFMKLFDNIKPSLKKAVVVNAEKPQFKAIVGNSEKVTKLKESIAAVAPYDLNVMILGETGTGKEIAARSIHENSPRTSEPYIAINCSAISENLLQSELFGHVKGAFSGAVEYHKGIFEQAGNGTVFLDEIGDIDLKTQRALLRVLETKDIKPVGSSESIIIKCRIVSATNVDLEAKVAKNEFRMDLLQRLNRFVIKTYPLREKLDDLPELCHYFLNENQNFIGEVQLSPEAINALKMYDWPGNARELRNEMEKLRVINSDKTIYELIDLDPKFSLVNINSIKNKDSSVSSMVDIDIISGKIEEENNLPLKKLNDVLLNSNNVMRRLTVIKDLFNHNPILTRAEIIKVMSVSHLTITRDLKLLIEEGFIKKVMPNKSPRSHYFEKI
ncbi:MAG: hypothetical protein COA79_17925 [Planctomycetota bacterium]|nr:MAG: hypothetical protein COA79_17925 [Planctomycetota bacterium]